MNTHYIPVSTHALTHGINVKTDCALVSQQAGHKNAHNVFNISA